MGPPTDDWLLFLGAGSSPPAPTRLPTFNALAEAVLRGLGWTPYELSDGGGPLWTHPSYPAFRAPALPPEVLFGTLRLFEIEFADKVAGALEVEASNAVHWVAAEVLRHGGMVWTTNIDTGVELACRERGIAVRRAGRAARRAPTLLEPLGRAGPGWLVKFHGSCEAPETLAFTDRELIAPLPEEEVRHLAKLARGRTVVLHGYAGADPDLYQLLDEVFCHARKILWFEPSKERRAEIGRAFPVGDFEFRAPKLPEGFSAALAATGQAFLEFAGEAGIEVEEELAEALVSPGGGSRSLPPFELQEPAGVTQARIVERFGFPGQDRIALRVARFEDLAHLRVSTLRPHLRWVRNNSVYREGVLAKALEGMAEHRWVLWGLPSGWREWAITRACAVLLKEGHWHELDDFVNWSLRLRGKNPSDLYYRAHARRYTLQIDGGIADAREARAGLSSVSDPERHAGALLEIGSMAVYQGRFEEALRMGFEIRYRTGKFAIPRWQAWGAWLEAVALCHLRRPAEARKALAAARERFAGERRADPLHDVRTVELLAGRVALARGEAEEAPTLDEDLESLHGRYRDDRLLVLCDLAIADGKTDLARERLVEVARRPSIPMAGLWARLALAEIDRLEGGDSRAAEAFDALVARAAEGGLWWLATQAILGLQLCDDRRWIERWSVVREQLPGSAGLDSPEAHSLGEPRVLWMLLT